MRRWFFYHLLAWRDILRLWATTQHQVVIIAGICLPILLLLGLKQGHVAELRKDLLTSPSGRQIVFWSAQGGALLDEQVLAGFAAAVPEFDLVIPETQRVVEIPTSSTAPGDSSSAGPDSGLVTLYSTQEGDPVLAQFHADVLVGDEPAIVLGEAVAKRLGTQVGEKVPIVLRRRRESIEETHTLAARVAAIIPTGDEGSQTGYAHISFLRGLEQYVRGYAVPRYELPAIQGLAARDEYFSYLLFCQKGAQTELQPDDFKLFEERGIAWQELDDPELMSLYGVLDRDRLGELRVYELKQTSAETPTPLRLSPLFITENTLAVDDFVLRWNAPLDARLDGQPGRVMGLSLPTVAQTGGWIRDYLVKEVGFGFEESLAKPFAVQVLNGGEPASSPVLTLDDGVAIPLDASLVASKATEAPPPSPEPADTSDETDAVKDDLPSNDSAQEPDNRTVLVVPANFLAWLHSHLAGHCRYDAQGRVFAPIPEAVLFDKARLYTKTIDGVPQAVQHLADSGYAVLSESNRIAEIQTQDQSLQLLVIVVAVGVLFFGIVTVISVLVDSTDRKRGTIGILRVMGMSRFGVFYLVIVRALFIGLLAALLSLALGYGFAWLLGAGPSEWGWQLPWKPIHVMYQQGDLAIVFIGALICAGVGALVPAWRAGSIDPFDAIMEGRFH